MRQSVFKSSFIGLLTAVHCIMHNAVIYQPALKPLLTQLAITSDIQSVRSIDSMGPNGSVEFWLVLLRSAMNLAKGGAESLPPRVTRRGQTAVPPLGLTGSIKPRHMSGE